MPFALKFGDSAREKPTVENWKRQIPIKNMVNVLYFFLKMIKTLTRAEIFPCFFAVRTFLDPLCYGKIPEAGALSCLGIGENWKNGGKKRIIYRRKGHVPAWGWGKGISA